MTQSKKNKSNILIAIESFFDGGAEMFAIRLANELALSQNVFFIELYPERTREKRQLSLLDKKRITILQPRMGSKTNGWAGKITNKLAKRRAGITPENSLRDEEVITFIKRNMITVVNSHSWDSDVYFAGLKKEIKFQLVSSFHGHYGLLTDKRINYDAITKTTLDSVDKVIYTSPEHQKTLDNYGFPASERHKIFYGVSMPLSRNVTKYKAAECLNIVMAARGIKEKGWEEAILAVLHLLKKYPGLLTLNLVGEGPYIDYLKTKYNDPAIQFLGYKNNVVEIVKAVHIGILPTYFVAESLPNTIIEYLFCGKPVITTNVGAIKEMMSPGSELAGTCIDLQNSKVDVDLISAAIENYLNNPALVEKHSLLALKAAEKFTMKTCIENYLNVFRLPSSDKN
ncbi:MAG TPA: glycosyltransferase family 4 protein [Hanamia sp.]